ncbi:MAG: phosphatidate cytidylyltransferase [Rhodobacteraceae bacterium]|nr:phosphatidate cytidylyltransferase [Paracoccaceae bacterium]
MSMGGNFADLRMRVISAIVLVIVGVAAIWAGSWVFLVLVSLVAGLMLWELVNMLDHDLAPAKAILLAVVGGAAVFRTGYDVSPLALASILLAPVLGMVLLRKDRGIFAVYGLILLFAVAGLFWIRTGAGLDWTIWLVATVIATDIGGYFFGRILGGPKILPAISPKKTWSGTVGGWMLAALVSLGFVITYGAPVIVIAIGIVTAIASQAGDVAESAIKRHSGVKDASNLIPGHGGFLDRFDALIAASLFLMLLGVLKGLPPLGGL